ncbi:unnamed protein product [Pedinophyceae sp. YPF-701]|nr:unnamed protein product [Pedinophyceae sp. YPF-701]
MSQPTVAPVGHRELQQLSAFLAKSDGKEKLLTAIQYASMFIAAGSPGNAANVQKSVAAARKVMHFLQPVQVAAPLVLQGVRVKQSQLSTVGARKLRALFLATYFGFDNLVWAYQVGLLKGADAQTRAQRLSWYFLMAGSALGVVAEVSEILAAVYQALARAATSGSVAQSDGTVAGKPSTPWALLPSMDTVIDRAIKLAVPTCQTLLGLGLLQLLPLKPRRTATFGFVAAVLNCYMLMPPKPPLPAPEKAKTS